METKGTIQGPATKHATGEAPMAELDPEKVWKAMKNPWDRHGNSWHNPEGPNDPAPGGSWGGLKFKLAASALLFVLVWGIHQLEAPWATPFKRFVAASLTEDMDFEAAAAWYEKQFSGAPTFIPIFHHNSRSAEEAAAQPNQPGQGGKLAASPVEGAIIVRPFSELLTGVELAAAPGSTVKAVQAGRVLQLSANDQGEISLAIQHANQKISLYGQLAYTDVSVDDWVEAGQPIGRLKDGRADSGEPSRLYFALREEGRYIDPAAVASFD